VIVAEQVAAAVMVMAAVLVLAVLVAGGGGEMNVLPNIFHVKKLRRNPVWYLRK
jgi:hypothetical protein